MTITYIITFCVLLLIAYLFDFTSSKTKIPSVILLLIMGWGARQIAVLFNINLPDFSIIFPVLGTVGLILIVLEGSLELEFNKSKIALIKRSLLGAFFTMAVTAFLLAFLFHYFGDYSYKDSLLNAIPFCVISSAIAIPSVRNLRSSNREFIIYESSLSDIMGVLFFNFIALNEVITFSSFTHFSWLLFIVSIISFFATIGLSLLLSNIEHHIKFVPIILLIILIYAISEIYHLPALIFILVFGLFIGNLDELKHIRWLEFFHPDALDKEVQKFKELTIEAAFVVRALFFLLFGYVLETSEILNTDTLIWAAVIVGIVFLFRIVQLKVSKLPLVPLLFVAPRGLITVLLFLSIVPENNIALVNRSLIIQVIVLSALLMMFGLMATSKKREGKL
ncbi:MAG TPA: cation:proton antiporter [Bacteroidales bacterium]